MREYKNKISGYSDINSNEFIDDKKVLISKFYVLPNKISNQYYETLNSLEFYKTKNYLIDTEKGILFSLEKIISLELFRIDLPVFLWGNTNDLMEPLNKIFGFRVSNVRTDFIYFFVGIDKQFFCALYSYKC